MSSLASKTPPSHKSYGYFLVLLSTLGFASYGVWSKLIGDTYGIFTQAWTRALIVCVVLVVVGLLMKQFRRFDRKDLKWLAVFVSFTLFTVAPIYYAFILLGVGTATMLFYAAYIVTSYLVGKIFLGEKITVAKLIAIILALVGIGLIFGIELAGVSLLAVFLAVLNGVASGGEVSFTKKISDKYSPLQLTLVSWVVILVTHFIAAAVVGENLFPVQTLQSGLGILAYAIVAMLAFLLVVAGYKRIEAGIGGLIGTLEVPFAILFGILLFGEQIGIQSLIGAVCIFLAAGIPDAVDLFAKYRRKKLVI